MIILVGNLNRNFVKKCCVTFACYTRREAVMTLAMLCKLTCSYHSDESADGCLANLKDQQTGHAVRAAIK
jgi:hypothetical protein